VLAVALVGGLTWARQARELEDTVAVQLLNIARTAVLLVDSTLHEQVRLGRDPTGMARHRLREALAAIQSRVLVPTPVLTLSDYDPAARRARVVASSQGAVRPAEAFAVPPEMAGPLGWTFEDGFARVTPVYRDVRGARISAFAPLKDRQGRTAAILLIDYPVEVYLDRLAELRATIVLASAGGGLAALALGLLFARRVTRPLAALTAGVERVAAGDLSRTLPVRSRDEVGRLTGAFNAMLEGLRQRDFIRATFGRYVSPEVARTLLESPEALRLGGAKREVTVLMSDLRGYTRFAEQGDPTEVMAVLNACLGRLSEVIIAHGGTVNEFVGDAVFAIFGAPLPRPDHPERAAAAALAMQQALAELNERHAARGWPRFEMGIGVHTGEAVVGNIGSEQRAKYGVVGSAVNTAARIEGVTVGGQVLVSTATWERVRHLAEAGPPLTVEVKGLSEPLVLHDLLALGAPYHLRLPGDPAGAPPPVTEVALPVECWVIEGKTVARQGLTGTAVRLGRRRLEARLGTRLAPLTNLRLRLTYPALGRRSGDLYGKVAAGAAAPGPGGPAGPSDRARPAVPATAPADAGPGDAVTLIHLTSVDPADERIIETFLAR
jgi:class 3 adenylate cyclase